MYCIYHSRDIDGWMSAAIVKKALSIDGPIEFIGWDYGQPLPELELGRKVVMVDISFPMGDMYKLAIGSRDLIWIDHHKSAIKDFHTWAGGPKGHEFKAFLARETGGGGEYEKIAACELTWEYFYPDTPMPEIVRLLGSYDSFRHVGTPEEDKVFHYQYAARTYMSNIEECSRYLEAMRDQDVDYWVKTGSAILQYEGRNAKAAYEHREDLELILSKSEPIQRREAKADTVAPTKKYKIAAVNAPRMNPKTYGINFHANGYDLFMAYTYSAKARLFTVSIYSEKEDCSVVAKAFGGGGHAGAAGFQIKVGNRFFAELMGL